MEIIPPDFLIIPYLLIIDDDINAIDEKLYGCIYWFSLLKRQKCTASNKTFALLIKSTPQSIHNSLTRLEKKGYIKRIFFDNKKRNRQEIIPLVRFAKVQLADILDAPTGATDKPVSATDKPVSAQNNNSKKEKQRIKGIAEQTPLPPLKEEKEDTTHKELTILFDYFTEQYLKKISDTPPIISWATSIKIGRPFIKVLGLEKMKLLIDRYLDKDNQYYKNVGWSLSVFLTDKTLNSLK